MRSPLPGFRVLLGVLLILAGLAPAALADAPWSVPQEVTPGKSANARPGGAVVEADGDVWAAVGLNGDLNNPVSLVQRDAQTGGWSSVDNGIIPWVAGGIRQSPPQVALGPGNIFYATFQTYNTGGCDRIYVVYRDPQNGAKDGEIRTFGRCNVDPPDLAVQPDGRGAIVWELGGRIWVSIKPTNWYGGFLWGQEFPISPQGCVAADPTIAATGDGNFFIAWRQSGCALTSGPNELWGTRVNDESFVEDAKPLQGPAGKLSTNGTEAEIAADPQTGAAHLTWVTTLAGGATQINIASRASNGTTWSAPQLVASSSAIPGLANPSITLAGSRVLTSWLDRATGLARVRVRNPAGAFVEDATTVGPATSSGSLLALPNGGIGLVYSTRDSSNRPTVYYTSAPPAAPAPPSPGKLLGQHSVLGDTPFDAPPWVTPTAVLKVRTTVFDPDGDGAELVVQTRTGGGAWTAWPLAQSPFLPAGEHTVTMSQLPAGAYEYRLAVRNNNGVLSDWVEAPTQAFTVVGEQRFEDDHPLVEYEAPLGTTGWGTQNAQGMPSAENYHWTNTPGAKVTFRFNGTSVRWIAQNGLDKGVVEIFLDGKSQGTVDLYKPTSAKRVYQQAIYTRTGLPNGGHTLTIVGTGKKNVAAKAAWWDVDAFDVPRDTTPPELKNVKATPATFSPDGDGVAETSVVSFDSAEWTRLTVRITRNGATIKTLADDQLVLGTFRGTWDGTTDAGAQAGDGQYTAVITGADLSGNPVRGVLAVPLVKDGSPAPPDTTPPGRVTGLTATPGDGSVGLSWALPNDPDVVGVRVLVRGDTFPTNPLTDPQVLDRRATSFTHTGLTNGNRYFYGVVAYDSSGNFGDVVTVDATPAPPARTPTPVVPSVTQTAGTQGQPAPAAVAPPAPEAPKPPSDPCAALAGRAKAACAAQATYRAAVARCVTRKGGAKAACMATAKAKRTYTLAVASCATKSGKAKASCLAKATATRRAALRKAACQALTGTAKARCLVKARRR